MTKKLFLISALATMLLTSCNSWKNNAPVVAVENDHGVLMYTHDSSYIYLNSDTCYIIKSR